MKKPENRIFTVPNVISIIRIICIPFFVYFFNKGGNENVIIAGVILICSGITDLFDGALARKLNQVTNLGKVLDPIADKLTEAAIAILLYLEFSKSDQAIYNNFLRWIFLFFIAKEALMLVCGGILLLCKVKPVAAEIYGKISTFSFYIIMVALLAFGPEIGAVPQMFPDLAWMILPEWITVALVITAALLAVVAFFSYFPSVYRAIKESKIEKLEAKTKKANEETFEDTFAKTEIAPRAAKIIKESEAENKISDFDSGAISFKKKTEEARTIIPERKSVVENTPVFEEPIKEMPAFEEVVSAQEEVKEEKIEIPEVIPEIKIAEPKPQKTQQEKNDFVDSLLDEILNDIKNKDN